MGLMVDYIISATHLYGLVHNSKVAEIYSMQHDESVGSAGMDDKAKSNVDGLRKNFVELHEDYFVHETIMEFDEFEVGLAKRQGKPFYIPDQQELLNYKDDLYFERTKEYHALKKYVQRHFFNGDAYGAEELCMDIHDECELGFSLDNVFQTFERIGVEFESKKQVQEVMALVMDFSNNVRLWKNNGFTPHELHHRVERPMLNPLPATTAKHGGEKVMNKKVGRNEPCPCGSGKIVQKMGMKEPLQSLLAMVKWNH